MKKITIDNAEYVVYGNNEKKDNLKPHIEVAETGIVPEGKQRGFFHLIYVQENLLFIILKMELPNQK